MTDLQFFFEKRKVRGKTEYALRVKVGDYDGWVLYTWKKKPTKEQVSDISKLIVSSMQFQHRHMRLPEFNYAINSLRDYTGELK